MKTALDLRQNPKSRVVYLLLAYLCSVLVVTLFASHKASAACPAPTTDYGKVSMTVNVPTTGTYRVWSRIMAPDATANSYQLDVDGTTCSIVVGDSTAIAANTWTWVSYKNGTTTSYIDLNLTAGNHTLDAVGREAGVKLDRIILTGDLTCVPDNTLSASHQPGDNCAPPPDNTNPVVSITAPANNASVSSTTNVTANATDNVAIKRVDFLIDGQVFGSDTTGTTNQFSASLDPSKYTAGAHVLTATAYDTSDNHSTSTSVTITIPPPPDTTKPTVSLTSPTASTTAYSGTISFTANATDNVAVKQVEFSVDGQAALYTDTTSPYGTSLDTKTLTNGTHTLTAKAVDTSNNSATASVTITVNNLVTPPQDTTKPTVSMLNPTAGAKIGGTYTLSANATDNVGVVKVTFIVDGTKLANPDTTAPFETAYDTTKVANGNHTFAAEACDAAGNCATSAAITANVSNVVAIPEDINQDGCVNLQDFSLLAGKFGQSVTSNRADINGDGTVDLRDFSLLAGKFGSCN